MRGPFLVRSDGILCPGDDFLDGAERIVVGVEPGQVLGTPPKRGSTATGVQ
jgi:hypothetical protein